jgi:uncharacterized membrane protein
VAGCRTRRSAAGGGRRFDLCARDTLARMTETDETGPIDWLFIEFPGGKQVNGELVPPLLDLVDRHIVRILDALIIRKADDGAVETLTTDQLDPATVGELGALAGASSGLIADDDAAKAAALLQNGSAGLFLVYENLWAVLFAAAARQAGGQVVADGRIAVQDVIARLDQLEA